MSHTTLSAAATDLVASTGNTARHLIEAYRAGGTHLAGLIDQRWDRAMAQSSDQLAADVRKNAEAAHALFNDYYAKGIALASGSASAVVDKVVELAGLGLQQAAANTDRFEQRTGVAALSKLAQSAVPAVVAVNKLAGRLERTSGQWADRVAGRAATPRKGSAFRQARARRAA